MTSAHIRSRQTSSISTPWGPSQHARDIADGITVVSTAGHGGVRLSNDRVQQMLKILGFIPDNFLGSSEWWEEDCDQAIPGLVFHEHYEPRFLFHALATVKQFAGDKQSWHLLIQWAEANEALMAKVEEYKQIAETHWLPGSSWTVKGKGWAVSMRKGDQTKRVLMDDYPSEPHYTDEQIAAMPCAGNDD